MKQFTILASVLMFVCCLAPLVRAQDQVETISGQLKKLPEEIIKQRWIDEEKATLEFGTAEDVIRMTLGQVALHLPNFYCIIHIVKWKTGTEKKSTVETQRWYVYHDKKWSKARLEGLRIYGSKNVGLLYIHLNARGVKDRIAYKIEVNKKLPAPIRSLISLLPLAGVETLDREDEEKHYYGGTVLTIKHVPSDVTVGASVGVPTGMKLTVQLSQVQIGQRAAQGSELSSAIVDTLSQSAGQSEGEEAGQQRQRPVTNQAGKQPAQAKKEKEPASNQEEKRSALEQASQKPGVELQYEPQEFGSQTYNNEGRYYWDVSVGIPLKKVNELEFGAEDGTVRVKKIDRQKLFAFVNVFYPKKVDTEGWHRRWPHAIVGVALSNRPLDRIFTGIGVGWNKVQFFAGAVYN